MSLTLTVLGGSPALPNPGQAASGYVIESDTTRLLMDCGSGIAAELRARDPGPLTAIAISHFHADHWFDLVPLHYAYLFGDWNTRPHPELHLPPGGRDILDSVDPLRRVDDPPALQNQVKALLLLHNALRALQKSLR